MTYPQVVIILNYMPPLTKATAKERALKVAKGLRKHKGSVSAYAKELGISRQAVQKKKNNPEFKSLRQQAIAKAAQRVGLTLTRIYSAVNDSLDAKVVACFNGEALESDAPDYRARLIGAKIGLELFEHLGGDIKEDSKPTEIHVHYGHRTKPPQKDDDG